MAFPSRMGRRGLSTPSRGSTPRGTSMRMAQYNAFESPLNLQTVASGAQIVRRLANP
jgi:hypothetical protein